VVAITQWLATKTMLELMHRFDEAYCYFAELTLPLMEPAEPPPRLPPMPQLDYDAVLLSSTNVERHSMQDYGPIHFKQFATSQSTHLFFVLL
jgi:hypothetical protein